MAGKYKLIKVGEDGWVHLPFEEMQKLLDDVYNDGYSEGCKNKYYYWTYPTTTTTPNITWSTSTSNDVPLTINGGTSTTGEICIDKEAIKNMIKD